MTPPQFQLLNLQSGESLNLPPDPTSPIQLADGVTVWIKGTRVLLRCNEGVSAVVGGIPCFERLLADGDEIAVNDGRWRLTVPGEAQQNRSTPGRVGLSIAAVITLILGLAAWSRVSNSAPEPKIAATSPAQLSEVPMIPAIKPPASSPAACRTLSVRARASRFEAGFSPNLGRYVDIPDANSGEIPAKSAFPAAVRAKSDRLLEHKFPPKEITDERTLRAAIYRAELLYSERSVRSDNLFQSLSYWKSLAAATESLATHSPIRSSVVQKLDEAESELSNRIQSLHTAIAIAIRCRDTSLAQRLARELESLVPDPRHPARTHLDGLLPKLETQSQ